MSTGNSSRLAAGSCLALCMLASGAARGMEVKIVSPRDGERIYAAVEDVYVRVEVRWEKEPPEKVEVYLDGKLVTNHRGSELEPVTGDRQAGILRLDVPSETLAAGKHTVSVRSIGTEGSASARSTFSTDGPFANPNNTKCPEVCCVCCEDDGTGSDSEYCAAGHSECSGTAGTSPVSQPSQGEDVAIRWVYYKGRGIDLSLEEDDLDYSFGQDARVNYVDELEELPDGSADILLVEGLSRQTYGLVDGSFQAPATQFLRWNCDLVKSGAAYVMTQEQTGLTRRFEQVKPDSDLYYLVEKTDSNGNTISLDYDGTTGALTKITDASGHEYTFEYDEFYGKQLISKISVAGRSWSYDYYSDHRLESETDDWMEAFTGGDYTITYFYNSVGQYAGYQDWDGATVSFTHNGDGILESMTDKLGNTRDYNLSPDTGVSIVTDQEEGVWRYEYSDAGILTRRVNPEGGVHRWFYDDTTYDLTRDVDEDGLVTRYFYDDSRNMTRMARDPQGYAAVTRWFYDAANLMTRRVDSLGLVTRYFYDGSRNLTRMVQVMGVSDGDPARPEDDPDDLVTRHFYDGAGNLTRTVDPEGRYRKYAYNSNGQIAQEKTACCGTTKYFYDTVGNLTRHVDGAGRVTRLFYDDVWRVERVRGANYVETEDDGIQYAIWRNFQYDVMNRLESYKDPYGNEIVFTYRDDGVVTYVSGFGAPLPTAVAGVGGLAGCGACGGHGGGCGGASASLPTREGTYDYDNLGRLVSFIDLLDYETAYGYDGLGRQISVTNAELEVAAYSYSSGGGNLLESVTDPATGTTSYDYDSLGRRTREVTAAGARRFFYDLGGRLTRERNGRGYRTRYFYDDGGRMTRAVDALDQVTRHFYDGSGNRKRTVDPEGRKTWFTYDGDNRLTSVKRFIAGARRGTTYTYTALNQPATVTDATSKLTVSTYHPSGSVATITDNLGNTTSYDYDLVGNRLSVEDANELVTYFNYDYDDNYNMTKIVDPENGPAKPTVFGYDAVGNRVFLTDAEENTTEFGYDGVGRLTRIDYPVDDYEQYIYEDGRLASRDNGGGAVSYGYYAWGGLESVSPPEGTGTTYGYDANGNVLSASADVSVSYAYDALDRLTLVTFSDPGKSITYEYDGSGLRTKMVDPESVLVGYGYDTAGRLTRVQRGGEPASIYSYDDAGRRTGLLLANGLSTSWGYDGAGRLASVSNGVSSFGYSLDAVGNRLAMSQSLGGVTSRICYGYDNLYRLTRELRWSKAKGGPPCDKGPGTGKGPGAGKPCTEAETAEAQVEAAIRNAPEFRAAQAAVTAAAGNGPEGPKNAPPLSWQVFRYDGVGNRLRHFGHNIIGDRKPVFERLCYNDNNQLMKIWRPDRTETEFEYDEAGNMTKKTETRPGASAKKVPAVYEYEFDYRNRMISYDGPDMSAAALLAAKGGGKKATDDTEEGEELGDEPGEDEGLDDETGEGVVYGYDLAGQDDEEGDEEGEGDEEEPGEDEVANVDAEEDGKGKSGTRSGKPTPPSVHVEYTFYPHHWARHSKTVGEGASAQVTKYIYDGDNVVGEYDDAGNAKATYLTPFLDQNLSMTIPFDRPNPGTYWYHADGLGSIRNITDATQAVVNTYDYEAFGQPFEPGTTEAVTNPYTFTARRRDLEAKLMYYRNRQYLPPIGRFLSRDPLGHRVLRLELQRVLATMQQLGTDASREVYQHHSLGRSSVSANLYVYADNTPTIFTDPTGEMPCWAAVALEVTVCTAAGAACAACFFPDPAQVAEIAGCILGLAGCIYSIDYAIDVCCKKPATVAKLKAKRRRIKELEGKIKELGEKIKGLIP